MLGRFRQSTVLVTLTGVLLLALLLSVLATQRAYRSTGTDDVVVALTVGTLQPGAVGCQPHEPIADGTSAVLLHITPPSAADAAHVQVQLRDAGPDSGTGRPASVTPNGLVAPLPRLIRTGVVGQLCVENGGTAPLELLGSQTGPADQITVASNGKPQPNMVGRLRVDDLTSARPASLWSVLTDLPDRVATATGSLLGPWLAGLGLLFGVIGVLALMRRGARRELGIVFLLSFAFGACWAGITPAFEKTDETAHFAYVQAFAELGHPPTQFADTGLLSGRLTCWYNGIDVIAWRFFDSARPPWDPAVRSGLDHSCRSLPATYNGAMYVGFQPPAYYALAAGAYSVASGLSLPSQLLFARLVSVLLASMSVAMTYLLVKELIRDASVWPARAAALALALQPVFMFNYSGVNPDALMLTVTTAIALLGAVAWRRGMTLARALGIGALTGLGLLTKTNFLTLLPSIVVLGGALAWGPARDGRIRRGLQMTAGAGLAGAILGVYALVNSAVWHRGLTFRDPGLGGHGGSLKRLLEFAWEFFLPRFGHMPNYVDQNGLPIMTQLESSLTRLGWWNDYGIASIWTPFLLVIGLLIAAGSVRYLAPRVRHRPAPLLTAVVCALLLLTALVYAGYEYSLGYGAPGLMPRYFMPLMCLWGLIVAAAVAAAPTRWRPPLTALFGLVFLGHTMLALATTVSRFYV